MGASSSPDDSNVSSISSTSGPYTRLAEAVVVAPLSCSSSELGSSQVSSAAHVHASASVHSMWPTMLTSSCVPGWISRPALQLIGAAQLASVWQSAGSSTCTYA